MDNDIFLDLWGKSHMRPAEAPIIRRDAARGIIQQNEEYLVIQTNFLHKLVFPGGEVEPGETDMGAIRREVREESGYQVGTIQPKIVIEVPSQFYMDGNFYRGINRYYFAGLISDVVLPRDKDDIEVDKVLWLPLSKITNRRSFRVMCPVLEKLRASKL